MGCSPACLAIPAHFSLYINANLVAALAVQHSKKTCPPDSLSSADPGTEAGAPTEGELRELEGLRQAAGEAPWTAGQVAALRWQC